MRVDFVVWSFIFLSLLIIGMHNTPRIIEQYAFFFFLQVAASNKQTGELVTALNELNSLREQLQQEAQVSRGLLTENDDFTTIPTHTGGSEFLWLEASRQKWSSDGYDQKTKRDEKFVRVVSMWLYRELEENEYHLDKNNKSNDNNKRE